MSTAVVAPWSARTIRIVANMYIAGFFRFGRNFVKYITVDVVIVAMISSDITVDHAAPVAPKRGIV